jgi:hypothetical protein
VIRTHSEYVVQGQPFTVRDYEDFRTWTHTWGLRFDELPNHQVGIFAPGLYAVEAGVSREHDTGDPRVDRTNAGFVAMMRPQTLFHIHGVIELLVIPHLVAQQEPDASHADAGPIQLSVPATIHGRWREDVPPSRRIDPKIVDAAVQVAGEREPRLVKLAALPAGGTASPIAEMMAMASDDTDEIVIAEIQHDRHFDVTRFETFTDRDFAAARLELESRGYDDAENLALRKLARDCTWIGRVAARTLTIRRDSHWSLVTHQDTAGVSFV